MRVISKAVQQTAGFALLATPPAIRPYSGRHQSLEILRVAEIYESADSLKSARGQVPAKHSGLSPAPLKPPT